jgi:5-methylcytosine-specific restriction endonuclease McrA
MPNEDGISQWISREYLQNTPLKLSSNGNSRHGIFYNDKRYIWEKQTNKNTVTHIRTNGFSNDILHGHNRPIRKDIRIYHTTACVVCGSMSDLVVDHKNDLYNDPRVLCVSTQTIDDFQCLCNHCNLQKRQVCKKTKETGKRYKATNIPMLKIYNIDFIQGDESFNPNDVNALVGTFWYDPVAFMIFIHSSTK